MGRDLEFGDDGDGLDLGRPWEFDVVADAVGRLGRLHPGIDTPCRCREDLAERDLGASHILGFQWVQIGADKSAVKSCSNIVRVAFCSQLSDISIAVNPLDGPST